MAETLLEVQGVETFYGNIQALHGVDLTVNKGEIATLIGANGAGKSTLLMTDLRQSSRRAKARSGSRARTSPRAQTFTIVRRGIAQSPEGRRIFPKMTVLENLQLGAITAPEDRFQAQSGRSFRAVPTAWQSAAHSGAAHYPAASSRCWPSPAP